MKSIKNIFNRKDTEAPEKRKFTIEEPPSNSKMPMVVEAKNEKTEVINTVTMELCGFGEVM